jgi:hypothetical protein
MYFLPYRLLPFSPAACTLRHFSWIAWLENIRDPWDCTQLHNLHRLMKPTSMYSSGIRSSYCGTRARAQCILHGRNLSSLAFKHFTGKGAASDFELNPARPCLAK